MALVMLLDQMGSRTRGDRVGEFRGALNRRFGDLLEVPFTRTTGDEMQAVLGPDSLGGVAREALTDRGWWIGIGTGEIERPLPDDAREGRGPAFWNARKAIERAKGRRRARPLAVIDPGDPDGRIEQCLSALAFVINRRTPSQRAAASAYAESEGDMAETAARLGMSVQGARKNVLAAGCDEEAELVSLLDWIATPAATG